MPANIDRDYSLWLTQHGQANAVAVSVLEFRHDTAFAPIFVSDYGESFAARTETAVDFVAQPLGFVVDLAADNVTTEQRVLIRMDNANGLVMETLRQLTPAQLQTPVTVIYRAYLDTKRTQPALDPVTLYVTNITGTRLAVEVEASADALPNVTAGFRYTLDRFPSLAYL